MQLLSLILIWSLCSDIVWGWSNYLRPGRKRAEERKKWETGSRLPPAAWDTENYSQMLREYNVALKVGGGPGPALLQNLAAADGDGDGGGDGDGDGDNEMGSASGNVVEHLIHKSTLVVDIEYVCSKSSFIIATDYGFKVMADRTSPTIITDEWS